jgi:hypothetical protein
MLLCFLPVQVFSKTPLSKKNCQPSLLAGGQSIELDLVVVERTFDKARLYGKYVAPFLEPNQVLVGATQEFKDNPLDSTGVEAEELKK